MTVGICNTNEILYSKSFSNYTSYSLFWNGTDQQSQINTDYCFTIVSATLTSVPITTQFKLIHSEVVLDYSYISVGDTVMFETQNLLVSIDLRDQWHQPISAVSQSMTIYDEDGNEVGKSTNDLKYNATLEKVQIVSRKTLYLNGVNSTYPHVTFYGKYESLA